MRIDLVGVDFMRIDLVGVDFVRIDLVAPNHQAGHIACHSNKIISFIYSFMSLVSFT